MREDDFRKIFIIGFGVIIITAIILLGHSVADYYSSFDEFTCTDFNIYIAHKDTLLGKQTYYIIEIHEGAGKDQVIKYDGHINIGNKNELVYRYKTDTDGNVKLSADCNITIDIATAKSANIID